MLKIFVAIGVSSALVFAPALALADESTMPPKADTVKTPGNGPEKKSMHHHHHHHSSKHMSKSMDKAKMMDKPAMAPADAPK